jgi:hypothetical protein
MNKITSISIEDCARIIEQATMIRDEAIKKKEAEVNSGEENIIVPAPKDDEATDQASTP